jgi:hypothetical protein
MLNNISKAFKAIFGYKRDFSSEKYSVKNRTFIKPITANKHHTVRDTFKHNHDQVSHHQVQKHELVVSKTKSKLYHAVQESRKNPLKHKKIDKTKSSSGKEYQYKYLMLSKQHSNKTYPANRKRPDDSFKNES